MVRLFIYIVYKEPPDTMPAFYSDMRKLIVILLLTGLAGPPIQAQDHPPNASKALVWSALQLAPSFTWTAFRSGTHFAFEWEAAPVLYSFGLNRLASPWKFFVATPVARYTGSIEAVVSAQVFTTKPGTSSFGYSGQVLGHIPLIERGEYLSMTIGGARYHSNGQYNTFLVGGLSTFFGMFHGTVKYAPSSDVWMTSLELRIF